MVSVNLYWYDLQTTWGHEKFPLLETKGWLNLDFHSFTVAYYVRTLSSKSPLLRTEKHWINTVDVECGRTFNHIINLVEAKHTTLYNSGRNFPCHQPWLNWVDTWSEITLIYMPVKVSFVLTCIWHNRCNGTTLSVSVKEVICISRHEWYKLQITYESSQTSKVTSSP